MYNVFGFVQTHWESSNWLCLGQRSLGLSGKRASSVFHLIPSLPFEFLTLNKNYIWKIVLKPNCRFELTGISKHANHFLCTLFLVRKDMKGCPPLGSGHLGPLSQFISERISKKRKNSLLTTLSDGTVDG